MTVCAQSLLNLIQPLLVSKQWENLFGAFTDWLHIPSKFSQPSPVLLLIKLLVSLWMLSEHKYSMFLLNSRQTCCISPWHGAFRERKLGRNGKKGHLILCTIINTDTLDMKQLLNKSQHRPCFYKEPLVCNVN